MFLGLLFIIEIPVLNANSVDPDQTPHYGVSDLDLLRLDWSNLWDARLKWVNEEIKKKKSRIPFLSGAMVNKISLQKYFLLFLFCLGEGQQTHIIWTSSGLHFLLYSDCKT